MRLLLSLRLQRPRPPAFFQAPTRSSTVLLFARQSGFIENFTSVIYNQKFYRIKNGGWGSRTIIPISSYNPYKLGNNPCTSPDLPYFFVNILKIYRRLLDMDRRIWRNPWCWTCVLHLRRQDLLDNLLPALCRYLSMFEWSISYGEDGGWSIEGATGNCNCRRLVEGCSSKKL